MGLQHQTRDTEVLIVGAGPTGLALAVDLARNGVAALVVERSGSLFPGSRGKGLQPRTLEVLDDLGVYEEIRAAGAPYPVGMVWQDGVRAGEHRMFDDIAPDESAPYAGPWMVPQWRTQEILAARLAELGGEIAFGREAAGVEQDAEGVTVTFVAGAPVRARYAVAADGGRSTVRRALGVGMTGERVDPGPMLVADLRITGLDRDNWHIFPPAGDAGFLAICPLAATEDFQAVAQFPEGARPDLSLDGIRAVVAARSHLAPDDVTEVRWASDFRPRAAMADRFRDGRVFLAGDSAHVHSPAGGQGLNTSVQDATTWAGSWRPYCAAEPASHCSTPTRRNGCRSPPRCSACPPASTAARPGVAPPPGNSPSATGTRPSPWRPVRAWRRRRCGPATGRRTGSGAGSGCSRSSEGSTGRCSPSARVPVTAPNCPTCPDSPGSARSVPSGSPRTGPTGTGCS